MFQLREGDRSPMGGVLRDGGGEGRERRRKGGGGRGKDSGPIGLQSILLPENVPVTRGPHRQVTQLQHLQNWL